VLWGEENDVRVAPECLGESSTKPRDAPQIDDPTQPLIGIGELAEMMARTGLSASAIDTLVSHKAPAVGLFGTGGCSEGPVGSSHLGGRPDVPVSWDWPERGGYPQGFLAELDLADLATMPGCDVLPRDGHLAFFYGFFDDTLGPEPRTGTWTVQWYAPSEPLHRADYPVWPPGNIDLPEIYNPSPITFFSFWTMPPSDSWLLGEFGASDVEHYRDFEVDYRHAISDRLGSWWPAHQLLGYPTSAFQGSPVDRYAFELLGRTTPPAHGEQASVVRPLLQIDTDGWSTNFLWGDGGTVFFMIPPEALDQHDFSPVWLDLQSH
jgi:hypothetical protein